MRLSSLVYGKLTSHTRISHRTDTTQLILIYPVLSTIGKPIIRDFVSAYFLKEILASDIIRTIRLGLGETPKFFEHYHVQERIQEKAERLRQILENDPVLRKFQPKISVITVPETLVNVPVVVGTFYRELPPTGLTHLLLVSILTSRPLYNVENLDYVYRVAVQHRLERVIAHTVNEVRRQGKIERYLGTQSNPTWIRRWLSNLPGGSKLIQRLERGKELPVKEVVDVVDNELKQAYLTLRVFLSPEEYAKHVGFNPVDTNFTIMRFQGNLDDVVARFVDRVTTAVRTVVSNYLSFIYNIFAPYVGHIPIDRILQDAVDECQNGFSENVLTSLEDFLFAPFTLNTPNALQKRENLCSRIHGIWDTINEIVDVPMGSQITDTLSALNKMTGDLGSTNSGIVRIISSLYPDFEKVVYIDVFIPIIKSVLATIRRLSLPNQPVNYQGVVVRPDKFLHGVTDVLYQILCFIFLANFVRTICVDLNFVKKHYDLSQSQAFSFPNYTLGLPMNSVMFLAHGIRTTFKNFQEDLKNVDVHLSPDKAFTYVYNTMCTHAATPFVNLIAVDGDQWYYRFVTMTRHLRTKESQIMTFVQHTC